MCCFNFYWNEGNTKYFDCCVSYLNFTSVSILYVTNKTDINGLVKFQMYLFYGLAINSLNRISGFQ